MSVTQTIRAWLIAISFAIVLFFSSIAIEALSDDFKEKLKPYRIWVWGILGLGFLVAVAGAIRELKNQRESMRWAESSPAPIQKDIETGDVNHSIQNTGDIQTVNQTSGGTAHLTLTLNNTLLGSQEFGSSVNKQHADDPTNVEWENRDHDLLKKYFSLCPTDDDQYRGYENWQERTIRERLFISGFVFEGLNGHTYLTREGVIFCCQHGQIPQATLFVDVRLKYDDVDHEEAIPYNNYSILALYFMLLERLTPLFQQGIELPGVRDSLGSAILVSEYPQLAIIEALVNFLIHRDYSQDDMGYITIYPDRVVFENPGQSEIPIEELLKADVALKPKYRRNQRLIQAFSYARLNQREGRGIQRIKEALEKNGSYLPNGSVGLLIENDAAKNRFVLTIYKRERPVTTVTDRQQWQREKDRYYSYIKRMYGTVQIMGMAMPVSLDGLFTDAYMLDRPTAFRRFDIERLKKMSADSDTVPLKARRTNGLQLVREKANLFILGKPGAGKTTFLKYIALKAAEQDIDKVPIFVSLKQWADSDSELLPFITRRFDISGLPNTQDFVEELLKSGSAIVLFDGLDEVNQADGQREKQLRELHNFIDKYDQTQYLITCRIAATDYSFEPFTYVEIADFTEKQIQTFVGHWFRNNEGERDKETRDRFMAEFMQDGNQGLRDLARTPLLLTLLCLSFNERLTFPRRRVEIYEEALDALLKKWDSSRGIKRDEVYHKLSLGHKVNMLARIAAKTFERNEYFIPQLELERLIMDYVKDVPPHDPDEVIDGEVILKTLEAQHGIFVERAREVYSFSHLTFQEYFTAKYIVNNAAKGTLKHLVKEHFTDSRWREVFLLTASLLSDAREFFEMLTDAIIKLANEKGKLKAEIKWINYIKEVESNMLKGESTNKLKLSTISDKRFTDFIYVIELFNDCLEIAYIGDRKKIISELFRRVS